MHSDPLFQRDSRSGKFARGRAGVEGHGDAQPYRLAHLPGWHIAKNENRAGDISLAQWCRLAHRSNPKHAGPIVQYSARNLQRPMAISVGLETDQHANMRPDQSFEVTGVAAYSIQINLDPGWALCSPEKKLLPARSLPDQLRGSLPGAGHQQFSHTLHA